MSLPSGARRIGPDGRFGISSLVEEGDVCSVYVCRDRARKGRPATAKVYGTPLGKRLGRNAVCALALVEVEDRQRVVMPLAVFDQASSFIVVFPRVRTTLHHVLHGTTSSSDDGHTGWWVAREAVSAVAAVHRAGVVHCGVEPASLVLTARLDRPHLALTDFEGAEREPVDQSRRPTGSPPLYTAPEVVLGEEYGRPVDLWAVGCVVVEFATGLPVVGAGEDPLQAHRALLGADGSADLLSRLGGGDDSTKRLLGVARALLLRAPADRPTAAEALQLIADVGPEDPGVVGLPRRRKQRKKRLVSSADVEHS
eukprot:TRINITY_DN47516_c0_g1_i1.p1 TRINITY_DN47516_c0_g1~~TRINITY_DN47516_c0_g1_i1.p1  ORF type:complete len:311 (+),score=68.09 TRINITY_DN47516_c0_g1_i1:67-999(+)